MSESRPLIEIISESKDEALHDSLRRELKAVKPSQDAIYQKLGVKPIRPEDIPRDDSPKDFEGRYQAYNFTTENLGAYMPHMDLNGKGILAVAGSSDFSIAAYALGAKDITAVDIMPGACLFGELKTAGLVEFDREDFMDFFATTGDKVFDSVSFDYHKYLRLRDLLSDTARSFFDQLIRPEGNHPSLSPDHLLITKIQSMEDLKNMSYYLRDNKTYMQAQARFKPVLYYPQSITDRLVDASHGRQKYDMVYLSNVPTYLKDEGKQRVISEGRRVLTPKGNIIYTQFRSNDDIDPYRSEFERGLDAHNTFTGGSLKGMVVKSEAMVSTGYEPDHKLVVRSLTPNYSLGRRLSGILRR